MEKRLVTRIRIFASLFVLCLVASGITAIPLQTELNTLTAIAGPDQTSDVSRWLVKIRDAVATTNAKYPFMAYGTDWLAFSHFVIAIAFIGPIRDPVKNIWVFDFGIIACAAVIPFAMIVGSFRGIPIWWRLIDCSFGVVGMIPLLYCRTKTKQLAELRRNKLTGSTFFNPVQP